MNESNNLIQKIVQSLCILLYFVLRSYFCLKFVHQLIHSFNILTILIGCKLQLLNMSICFQSAFMNISGAHLGHAYIITIWCFCTHPLIFWYLVVLFNNYRILYLPSSSSKALQRSSSFAMIFLPCLSAIASTSASRDCISVHWDAIILFALSAANPCSCSVRSSSANRPNHIKKINLIFILIAIGIW